MKDGQMPTGDESSPTCQKAPSAYFCCVLPMKILLLLLSIGPSSCHRDDCCILYNCIIKICNKELGCPGNALAIIKQNSIIPYLNTYVVGFFCFISFLVFCWFCLLVCLFVFNQLWLIHTSFASGLSAYPLCNTGKREDAGHKYNAEVHCNSLTCASGSVS